MNSLKDKNFIVTGASGGIGNSIVEKLYEYRARYSKVLLSEDEYYHEFKKKMNFSLDI